MKRFSPTDPTPSEPDSESLKAAQRQFEEAVRSDQEGYERWPVGEDEFAPVLGAQTWPE